MPGLSSRRREREAGPGAARVGLCGPCVVQETEGCVRNRESWSLFIHRAECGDSTYPVSSVV